ncbi:hypothetical protein DFH07DRAFT_1006818 [Mycena maculata]|uniref:Uncharacterized protein n=1 Tax=Mycena maculata TaxID=230809 RepID=A0AAD7NNN9_9AGAR|nr:hypothetical protein DFH07DRAFT_1006818 [Mycena maculata]
MVAKMPGLKHWKSWIRILAVTLEAARGKTLLLLWCRCLSLQVLCRPTLTFSELPQERSFSHSRARPRLSVPIAELQARRHRGLHGRQNATEIKLAAGSTRMMFESHSSSSDDQFRRLAEEIAAMPTGATRVEREEERGFGSFLELRPYILGKVSCPQHNP